MQYLIPQKHLRPWDPGYLKATDVNWHVKVGDPPAVPIVCLMLGRQHHHVEQSCASIQPSFRCTNSLFGFCLDS